MYKPGAWPQEVIERGHAFALHQDDARPEVKVPHMILYTCAGSTFMNTVHELYAKYKYGDILRSRDVIFTHSDPFWLYVEPRDAPPAVKYRMEGDTLIFVPLQRTVQTRTPFYPYVEYRTIRRPDSRQGVIDEFARMIRMSDGAELYGAVVNEGFFGPSNSQYYSGYFDRGVSPLVQRLGELGNYVFWAKGPAKGPGAYSDSPITRINGASKQPLDETDNVAGKDQMCRNRLEIWVPVNRVSVARFFKYSTSLFNPYARATDGEGAANADRKLNPELHHTYVLMPGKFKFIKYEHADFLGARRHNTVVQLLEDDEEVAAALS